MTSQRKALHSVPGFREIFTHQTLGEFDVTALRAQIAALGPAGRDALRMWSELDAKLLDCIATSREVDLARCEELTPRECAEPAIVLDLPSGEHLLIDGHHRLVARARLGRDMWHFYLIPLAQAPRYVPDARDVGIPWGELDVTPNGFKKRSIS